MARFSLLDLAGLVLPGVRQVNRQKAGFAAHWADANAAALDAEGPLLVVVGDSTAVGIGASSPDRGFAPRVRDRLAERDGRGWRLLNLGATGAQIPAVIDEQLARLAALGVEPDLLVCSVGSNDLLRARGSTVEARAERLLDALPAGSVVLTLTEGMRASAARPVNRLLREGAPRRGHAIGELWARIRRLPRGSWAADGFHPDDGGYDAWVEATFEGIDRLGARER